ncbi:protein Wnt-4 [Cylas formicarius]|uniref:protein Wnt-4 n=1 Tax=Cylas formicarius TaxID=197179 RepID=UPI002958888C|nr:protein Wnt-4 [Cylas formicarius]
MRFLNGRKLMPIFVWLYFYSSINSDGFADKITAKQKSLKRRSLVALFYTSNVSAFEAQTTSKKENCRWLRGMKYQAKLCRNRSGLAEILQKTKKLARSSCQTQFEFEQWNCSSGNTKKIFKKLYRETAFIYSLTTSAFLYSVAKACAEGSLANCKCASHGKSTNVSEWQWGGCGDNSIHARALTKNFFQLRKKGDNSNLNTALRYNSEVGIRVAMEHEEKYCKCHGISGSCSMKICWKRLKPFQEIAKSLKDEYHRALHVEPDNNTPKIHQGWKRRRSLLFVDYTPDFCPTTTGRRCRDEDNCASLCCARGFTTSFRIVKERCKCRWRNETLFQVECKICEHEEMIYHCR